MNVEDLITAMQETKAANPTLELSDILKMYHIQESQELVQAIKDLTKEINVVRINNDR